MSVYQCTTLVGGWIYGDVDPIEHQYYSMDGKGMWEGGWGIKAMQEANGGARYLKRRQTVSSAWMPRFEQIMSALSV